MLTASRDGALLNPGVAAAKSFLYGWFESCSLLLSISCVLIITLTVIIALALALNKSGVKEMIKGQWSLTFQTKAYTVFNVSDFALCIN